MMVFPSRDHAGKPTNPKARGASFAGFVEAMLTPLYLLHMEQRLLELKHDVLPISDGIYTARHERAKVYAENAKGRTAYVAAHFNAGGGNYAAIFYDKRSSRGASLAAMIAEEWERALYPEIDEVKTWYSQYGDWTGDAHATIEGVYSGRPTGVVLEPCFIDNPNHHELLTDAGLRRIGYATAQALHAWSQP